ncbi:MAG: hypothetical protein IKJ83_04910 [Ruminococcus sp.]|nr:hypothetical protein [Ruminococcus sp.]
MKKLLSLILVTLIICISLGVSATSAAGLYSNWILGEDAMYLTHGDDVYYPVYSSSYLSYDGYANYGSRDWVKLQFSDEKTEEKYKGSTICFVVATNNFCVSVYLNYNDVESADRSVVYVREDYLDEYSEMLRGEGFSYSVNNDISYEDYRFSEEVYDRWKNGEAVTIPANSIYKYAQYSLCVYDRTQRLSVVCSEVLWDIENSEIYLLQYHEFDHNKVYSKNDTLTVYKLEDSIIKEKLIEYFSVIPEDDLEWLNPGPVDIDKLYTLSTVLFCVLPLALLSLSTVMFFIKNAKKYRRSFSIIAVGSALVLIAFIVLCVLV